MMFVVSWKFQKSNKLCDRLKSLEFFNCLAYELISSQNFKDSKLMHRTVNELKCNLDWKGNLLAGCRLQKIDLACS